MRRFIVAFLAIMFVSSVPPDALASGPEDEAAAYDAVAIFNQRLDEAGWRSVGPPNEEETASDEEGEEESEFGDCLGELFTTFERGGRVEGETAHAFSDQFLLIPAAAPTSTFDYFPDFASAMAFVITVDEPSVEALDSFVDRLGDDASSDCLSARLQFEEWAEENFDEVEVTQEPDLGVGDVSANATVDYSGSYEGQDFLHSVTLAAARTGRSLVVVLYFVEGAPETSLDPVAELTAIVEALE
jgi:hypothetical protein